MLCRCYEANPPFVPQLITKMAQHMTELLKKAKRELCFIIVIPAWNHTEVNEMIFTNILNVF